MILNDIVKAQDKDKEKRIDKAKRDFFFFAKAYFPHLVISNFADYQKALIDIINKNSVSINQIERLKKHINPKYHDILKASKHLEGIIDIEPRGHGKTTRMSVLYPLWRLLSERSKFIVVFSASEERANQILDDIKFELENNERLIEDFGELKGRIWKANFIELKIGAAIASRGAGASTRGLKFRQYRPDLVILDDIMKDDAINSKAQRDKIYRWFKRVIIPLGKDIFVVVVNTIFHNDDLPSRLLYEIKEGKMKGWLGLRFAAIVNNKPLWRYWSIQGLLKKKSEMGSLAFSTEYMNEPISDEDRIFKEEWIEYDKEDIDEDLLRIIMGVDPALGGGDYSAIAVVGVDAKGIIHVLDAEGFKASPDKFMDKIIARYMRYKPRRIMFEEVAFQSVMKDFLIQKAAELGVYLPIKGIKPGRVAKEMRIAKLSPLIENRLIRFRENQKLLIEQLLSFPKGDHDDLCDALAYAVDAVASFNRAPGAYSLGIHRAARYLMRRY
jgi:predicted phage terminase large subunit-like protein